MKRRSLKIIMLLAISATVVVACKKADAVFFEDNSTAAKADKTGWTVTASSQEVSPGFQDPASNLLDGDINTIWRSARTPVILPYPHWVVIDMKNPLSLISVDITARQNNGNGMTKFKLEGSADGNTWINLGKSDNTFNPATITPQGFQVSSATSYRFIKMTALEGKQDNTFLAEVDVFTPKK